MKTLNDKDRHLFRDTIGHVRPVKSDRVPRYSRKPKPHPHFRERDDHEVIQSLKLHPESYTDVLPGETIFFARPEAGKRTIRRLKRGHYRMDAELDLHGLNLRQAYHEVKDFIKRARERDWYCVRIIHGKGLRSSNKGPVLKPNLAIWLKQIDDILIVTSAPLKDGGAGAVYVMLKKKIIRMR